MPTTVPFQLNWYHYNATWVTNLLFPNFDWKPQTYWYTLNFVDRHFVKCLKRVLKKSTAVHTEVRSSLREAQKQQSWLKRQLYCSLTLPLLLSAIFLFATKDSMPGFFFFFFMLLSVLSKSYSSTFFLDYHTTHLISCK